MLGTLAILLFLCWKPHSPSIHVECVHALTGSGVFMMQPRSECDETKESINILIKARMHEISTRYANAIIKNINHFSQVRKRGMV